MSDGNPFVKGGGRRKDSPFFASPFFSLSSSLRIDADTASEGRSNKKLDIFAQIFLCFFRAGDW